MTPRFQLAGFPVQVHPLFFLTGLALGAQWLSRPAYLVVWFCVFFVSVLVHELGHALMFRRWGSAASIALHGLGGTTTGEGASRLTHRQEFWVSLAGPGAGLLLAGLVWTLRELTPVGQAAGLVAFTVWCLLWANFFVSLFNLLPIYPMDGGQAMAAVIRRKGGPRSEWLIHLISLVTAAAVLLYAILTKNQWTAMFALILGVLNLVPLWRTRVERRYMIQLRAPRRRTAPSDEEAAASVNRLLEDLRLDSRSPARPPPAAPHSPAPARARAPEPEPPDVPQDPQFMGKWLLDNGLAELAIRPLQATFAAQPSAQAGHSLVTALLDAERYEEVRRLLASPGAAHLGAETLELIATRAQAAGQSALLELAREHSRALFPGRPHDSEKPG
jgi:stage IV sporulation protein FB